MPRKNNFFDKDNFLTIDTFRIIYFLMFLGSFALTEIGRFIYRPYIYNNNISDFGIADSIGNFGGIIVQIYFAFFIINPKKRKGISLIIFFTAGYILYETIQPILPKGVFDWKDIYATLIGGIFGLIIFLILHSKINNRVIKRFN